MHGSKSGGMQVAVQKVRSEFVHARRVDAGQEDQPCIDNISSSGRAYDLQPIAIL